NSLTGGALADSFFNTSNYPDPFGTGVGNLSYATIKADLQAHSTLHPENTALTSFVANLPAGAPACAGCNSNPPHFMLGDAQAKALGLATGPGGPHVEDGFIELNA